jgi:hypothetical protein
MKPPSHYPFKTDNREKKRRQLPIVNSSKPRQDNGLMLNVHSDIAGQKGPSNSCETKG